MTIPGFRRLVLELSQGAADPATMRDAAGFARVLGLDLLALFMEDEALLHASALPFSREIDPVTHRWRRLRPDRLENELRAVAALARRHLAAAARDAGISGSLEVHRGDPGPRVAEICVETDIVMLCPPRMGEAVHGSQRMRDTARDSAASVLWLPPGGAPTQGPVVAVAADGGDVCVALARQFADRAEEPLLVAMPGGGDLPLAGTTAADLANALGHAGPRLIAMSRGGPFGALGPDIAALLRVPVLVLE